MEVAPLQRTPLGRAQSTPPTHVSLINISVRFGTRWLFCGLSFDLLPGEWTCLLGASGIGKSTLARLILGLSTGGETSGEVRFSTPQPSVSPDRSRVAWMAQQDLLYPWLTVLDNVLLGGRLRGTKSLDRDRALCLLEEVGLSEVTAHFPSTLSAGMRQRIALARTLMEDSPVVVLDEPFAALDALTRAGLQELAFTLLLGRTTFLITHDPLEALRLGHRIYVLADNPARLRSPLIPVASPLRGMDTDGMATMHGTLLHRLCNESTH